MESSKEKIEAQLCAYVEGELDDAERAEIEQHLAANPQHQALIAELRVASGLLRDLPRVPAPIELNEGLCGQLERGALLDPTDDDTGAARHVNRWPQLTAVAAVLILAVGLGLVIYYVLPPSSGGQGKGPVALDDKTLKETNRAIDSFAKDRGSDAASNGNVEERMKETEAVAGIDAKLRRKTASGLSAAPATTNSFGVESQGRESYSTMGRRSAGDLAQRDLDVARTRGLAERPLVTPAEVENVRKWMNESLGTETSFFKSGGGTSLYLVVSTPNAAAANGQLAAYFKDNGIQYMANDTRAGTALAFNSPAPAPVAPTAASDLAGAGGRDNLAYGGKASSGGFGGTGGGGAPGPMPAPAAAPPSAVPALQPAESKDDAGTPAKPDFSLEAGRNGGVARSKEATLDEAVKQEVSKSGPAGSLAETGRDGTLEKSSVESKKGVMRGASAAPERSVADATKDLNVKLQDRYALSAKDKVLENRLALGDADHRMPAGAAQFGDQAAATTPGNGGEAPVGGNSVIVARMNRRQLNELSTALSREQGQRAELKEFAPSVAEGLIEKDVKDAPAATVTALGQAKVIDPSALTLGTVTAKTTANGAVTADTGAAGAGVEPAVAAVKPVAASRPANLRSDTISTPADHEDALRLKVDPLDEPVDVVIVVKSEMQK